MDDIAMLMLESVLTMVGLILGSTMSILGKQLVSSNNVILGEITDWMGILFRIGISIWYLIGRR